MKNEPNNKLIAVVGPTSSGKSELAVKLAKKFKGEIVSVDSRQIYKGMDLGTGKVPGKWSALPFSRHPERAQRVEGSSGRHTGGREMKVFIYKNISHHLVDFVSPKRQYSVSLFQKKAQKTIREIQKRGRLPILCGGTGHWIDAIAYNQTLPNVKPNPKLRAKLEKQPTNKLYGQLRKLDPARAANIDQFNKRRLVRALEIVITTGKAIPPLSTVHCPLSAYNVLWLGINLPQDELYKKIDKRLKQRLGAGMVNEVRRLRKQGLSWKRLDDFGLEYRFISQYLQKKISYQEMLTQISLANKHYSKRQMTWFRRNPNIHWIASTSEAYTLTKNFL